MKTTMADKLLGLWNAKRWLFFILIIPVGFAFIYKMLMENNASRAIEEVKESERHDVSLKKEQDSANNEADKLKRESGQAEEEIKEIKTDEDWYKKL